MSDLVKGPIHSLRLCRCASRYVVNCGPPHCCVGRPVRGGRSGGRNGAGARRVLPGGGWLEVPGHWTGVYERAPGADGGSRREGDAGGGSRTCPGTGSCAVRTAGGAVRVGAGTGAGPGPNVRTGADRDRAEPCGRSPAASTGPAGLGVRTRLRTARTHRPRQRRAHRGGSPARPRRSLRSSHRSRGSRTPAAGPPPGAGSAGADRTPGRTAQGHSSAPKAGSMLCVRAYLLRAPE